MRIGNGWVSAATRALVIGLALQAGCDGGDGSIDAGTSRDGGVPLDPRADALDALLARSEGPTGYTARDDAPIAITGRFPSTGASTVERARSFLAENAALFRLDDERSSLEVVRSTHGRALDHVLFAQRIDGIAVNGGGLGVLLEGSTVVAVYGNVLPPAGLALRPSLTAAEAAARVMHADDALGGAPALVIDAPRLVAPQEPAGARLAYRIPLGRGLVVLDARTGEVLREAAHEDRALDLDVYRRQTSDEVLAADELGCVNAAECTPEVLAVRDGFTAAYDWYATLHGWIGHDGQDGDHRSVVRYDADAYTHLSWDLFKGDVFDFEDGDVAMRGGREAVGHEWFHSVINHTSDIDRYFGEPGGIEESMAHTMGLLLDGDFGYACGPGAFTYQEASSSTFDELLDFILCSIGIALEGGGTTTSEATQTFLARLVFETNLGAFSDIDFAMLKILMTTQAYALRRDPADPHHEFCIVEQAFRRAGIHQGVVLEDGTPVCPEIDFADVDRDHVDDLDDNCVGVANYFQTDQDHDHLGDACDPDIDADGVPNESDNCAVLPNPDQDDTDGVGGGDVCDWDDDGDLLADQHDNCVHEPNPGQEDLDGDGEGDACDPDADGDAIPDDTDLCPFLAGGAMGDSDFDGLGDACDPCPTDASPPTGYTAGIPALGLLPAPIVPDLDGDGVPDACDSMPLGAATVTIDGVPYVPGSLTPGRAHHLEIRGAARPIPLPLTCLSCDGAFDESLVVELFGAGLPAGARLHVLSDRGSVRSSADANPRGEATLRWAPRGAEQVWLFVVPPTGVADVDLDLTPTEPSMQSRGDCAGARDGAPCAVREVAGTCDAGTCVPSHCGDGVLDRDEDCDDGNAIAGDGCEPTSCTWSCTSMLDCDDGNVCTMDACASHVCASFPRPGGVCTTPTGSMGSCNMTGLCVAPGCGNAAMDAGEECDDGNGTSGDGCDPDCTYSCESAAECDDSDVCTGTESCALATHTCTTTGALDCDDTSACTTDACDRVLGCQSALIDADHDGHAPSSLGACGTDCDDTSSRVSPDDPEVCNTLDDDCDGSVDEGLLGICYRDMDADGAGASGMSMMSCGCPAGWTAIGGDCDDGNRSVNPSASFHASPYCPPGASCPPTPGSFDYDCSGAEEPQWADVLDTCPTRGCAATGWTGSVPGCGVSSRYLTCSLVAGRCSGTTETRTQACR
ncbi:MAG: thrombospondin type 3 repeat-containing protein [Sandaracinaceae bacterium]|nr:thrombospondin type 3 repeat-containing protein [Sandaracinaceae bacterium]